LGKIPQPIEVLGQIAPGDLRANSQDSR